MAAQPQTQEELEQKYYEITELYDLAEELADTVESEFVANPEEQLQLVEPLIEQVGEAADVLTEEYISLAEGKKLRASKNRIEGALRRIYVAIDTYHKKAMDTAQQAGASFMNIADPIVKKIKRQMEAIIGNFMELIDLSLDRIMQKSEIEDLKRRQERIAMMLHQLGQAT